MAVTGTVKRDIVGAVVGALTEWDPPNAAAGGPVGGDITAGLTYSTKSISIASDTANRTPIFKADGTEMYLAGDGSNVVNQYTLSVAWDISSATLTGSGSPATETTSFRSIAMSPDGTTLFVASITGPIYQYTLSTPWLISSMAYATKTTDIGPTLVIGMFVNSAGTRLFAQRDTSPYTLTSYDLTSWDASTIVADGDSFAWPLGANAGQLCFSADGYRSYVNSNGKIYQANCSVAWDLTTMVDVGNIAPTELVGKAAAGMWVDIDNNRLMQVETTGDVAYQYTFDDLT